MTAELMASDPVSLTILAAISVCLYVAVRVFEGLNR